MWIWTSIVALFFYIYVSHAETDTQCSTPNGESAICLSIYKCQTALNVFPTENKDLISFWQKSQCGYDDQGPRVCCGALSNHRNQSYRQSEDISKPSENVDHLTNPNIPSRDFCGYQENNRILGGEETQMDEFPWMALLQYQNSKGFKDFQCTGTLIASRFVLTAAHCVDISTIVLLGTLVKVRLGEWDTSTDPDCISVANRKFCNPSVQDMDIDTVVIHGQYDRNDNSRQNDIALIKLSTDVKFTSNVRPICLPLKNEILKDGDGLYVSGWGRTSFSSRRSRIKQKLRLALANKSNCTETFLSSNRKLSDKQICAGGEDGKDTCQGDSGGPLMRLSPLEKSQWSIEGIVSFRSSCGSTDPGVYTKVTSYLDWIYSNANNKNYF